MNLEDYGFGSGIWEVIATTWNERPNAAPVGIRIFDRITAVLYRGTHTCENVRRNGRIVANVCRDPVIFVRSAFEDLESDSFEIFEGIPVIRGCDAWILFSCTPFHEDDERCTFELSPLKGEIRRRSVAPFSRGLYAIIEAAVLATKLVSTGKDEYRNMIERCLDVVEKCGGNREREAMRILLSHLKW